jgi:hypothetical protein
MQTLYAVQFTVPPSLEDSPIDAERILCDKITAWISGWYKDKHKLNLNIGIDSNELAPLPSHHISILASSTINTSASQWALNWSYDSDLGKTWYISPSVARVGQEIEVSLVVGFQSVVPLDKFRYRPQLAPDLINSFECWMGNRKLSTKPVYIQLENIEEFVSTTLPSKERTLPIVVISPVKSNEQPLVDSLEIALWLAGIAEVFVLANTGTAFELIDQIGDRLACYNGAVRVYRPKFSTLAKPEEHPVYLSSNSTLFRDGGRGLRYQLFEECASISAARFTAGKVTQAAREAIKAEETENLIKTRTEALKNLEDKKEFSALLEVADKHYAELTQQRDELAHQYSASREELANAREEIANLKANLQSIWQTQVPESFDEIGLAADEPNFSSVLDAVKEAEEKFIDTLIFLKGALTSSEKSSYYAPHRVFHAFEIMDVLCRKRREALSRDEKIGRLEDLFLEKGLKYSPHISEATKGQWGDEYEVQYEGKKVRAHEHIKLGNNRNPEYCLRIHFFRDDKKYKFIVVHVGEHKTNTQT